MVAQVLGVGAVMSVVRVSKATTIREYSYHHNEAEYNFRSE